VHRPFHSSHDKTASLGATAFQHRLSMAARSILYPGVGTSRQERKSRCRAVWSLGALLAYCVLALCPLAIAQQYPTLPVAGSPKNIRFLFQDSKGRLWVGGDRLACFDGARFYSLTDYGFPAVPSYAVSEDSGGAIWIGAATGIYRYSGGRVQEVSKGATVSVVAVSPDLVLAAVGPMGKGVPATASLVRASRKGDSWKTETIMDLDSASPLTLDHAGMVLYPWPKQGWNELRLEDIVRWRQGEKLVVTHHPISGRQATAPAAGPMRVQRDRFGCVWLGSDTSNIYQCGHDQWRAAPFEGASVRSNFTEAADGSMLLTGYNILAAGRPGSFKVARAANGLPALSTGLAASDGTLWLGCADGLYRFASPFRMEYWTARDGVDSPWSIRRSGTEIYAGLDRHVGVLGKDRQHWQSIAAFDSIGQVVNLFPGAAGSLLVALNPGGAALIGSDGALLARTDSSPKTTYGLRFAAAPGGETWLGGVSLWRITRNGPRLDIDNHRFETQPAGNVLDVQYEETTRKLWACYNGGLAARNQDGQWREFTTRDGLLVDPCWSLAALPNGDVWYGYYNAPVFARIRPSADGRLSVRQFREGGDIRDPESITFDVDSRGWLWRGGNRGLSLATPAQAEAGNWLYLDRLDGLPGEGVNSGSYFADADGSVWMGADLSIVHYQPPADLLSPAAAPLIAATAVSWDGQTPKLSEAVDGVPPGRHAVAHIGSLQFDRRNALRVRYRILPDQPAWRESSSLDVPVGSLSSGTHRFEVQGRVFTGPWSPITASTLTVLAPMWRTPPLLLSYAIVVLLMCTGAYLLRRRRTEDDLDLLPDIRRQRIAAFQPEVEALAGTVLDDRFEVGDLLAQGGFANVMDGYDRVQAQRCAIKVFRSEIRTKDGMQRKFRQEVAALERIHHPNVVSIYANGHAPSGTPYLVMQFIDGRDLRAILMDGPLPANRAANVLRDLAAALDAIHAHGVWHRDVKPENIMIRNEGLPQEDSVLIDFSIAIVKDANETLYGLSRAEGSFDYMAPEQAMGYAEPSSDIYSLARVVIEMITGQQLNKLLPAAGLDLPERVRVLLPTLAIRLSPESIEMLASALEFDPSKRPRAAGAFAVPVTRDLGS
jgi:ligand-binding sensor domain-containing protein/tRNA A-37 threonylcarbamoyl transferase component Bud32